MSIVDGDNEGGESDLSLRFAYWRAALDNWIPSNLDRSRPHRRGPSSRRQPRKYPRGGRDSIDDAVSFREHE
jgi:hypothetical protein